jgi:hypothetical protein
MSVDATNKLARPEKPDEEKYKADLAQAEKELKQAQELLVGLLRYLPRHSICSLTFFDKQIADVIFRTALSLNSTMHSPTIRIPHLQNVGLNSLPNYKTSGRSRLAAKLLVRE